MTKKQEISLLVQQLLIIYDYMIINVISLIKLDRR